RWSPSRVRRSNCRRDSASHFVTRAAMSAKASVWTRFSNFSPTGRSTASNARRHIGWLVVIDRQVRGARVAGPVPHPPFNRYIFRYGLQGVAVAAEPVDDARQCHLRRLTPSGHGGMPAGDHQLFSIVGPNEADERASGVGRHEVVPLAVDVEERAADGGQ